MLVPKGVAGKGDKMARDELTRKGELLESQESIGPEQVEELSRGLLESAQTGIYIIQDGKFVYVNPEFKKAIGRTGKELIGRHSLEFVHPGDRERVREEAIARLKGEKTSSYEYRVVRKDGEIRWIFERVSSFQYRGRPAVMGNFMDITERKEAEEELGKEKKFSQNVLATIPDSLLVVDKNLRVKSANRAFHETFQIKPKKVLGSTIAEILHDEEGELTNRLTKLSGTEDMLENFEMVYKSEGLGERILNITARGMRLAEEEEEEEELIVIQDITERKIIEERERRELVEKAEAQRQFINILAHELRTPLTPIFGSARMLAEQSSEKPGSFQDRLIHNILRGTETLESRLSELLDLAQFQAGAFTLEIAPLDPRVLLREMARQFQPAAESKGQSLAVDLPDSLPQLRADRRRLEQVMMNLLGNAVKFTPEGGNILLKAMSHDQNLVVEVHNNGESLSPGEQQRLFQPYYRSEVDRQRLPGTGLGLALCRELVEAHGGKIWVESEAGKETILGFAVPLEGQAVKIRR